ncbi:MBL fold metallo-hydrolase [Rhodovibrionaceae bacterium A322]
MSSLSDFTVKFWGVRGSIACPGHDFERYGGNTSCLEVRCGNRLLILDAGTGLRSLGSNLCVEQQSCGGMDFDIFLTHTHMDHIAGIPFFGPFFEPRNTIRLHAGHLAPERSLNEVLCNFMADPIFPVPPEIFEADVHYLDFQAGKSFDLGGGITMKTTPLNHPNRATGYRVEYGGRAICYVTDTEHYEGRRDPAIVELIKDAEYVVYDCSYSDEEYEKSFKGWGHSTWQEGLRLVEAANAKNLVIFHHDPAHNDDAMDAIAEKAQTLRPGTVVAREGLVLTA